MSRSETVDACIVAWWKKAAEWFVACVHKLTCINATHWASQEKLAEYVMACGCHLIATIPVYSGSVACIFVEKEQPKESKHNQSKHASSGAARSGE